MVPFETARRAAVALARPIGRRENVAPARAAGRILAAPVEAPHPLPAFDQAAMDGYAVRLSGRDGLPMVLPVMGRTMAGDPPGVLAPGAAHRIMTGAALPGGADTVVMQEHATRRGDLVQLAPDVERGAHIRRRGEDIGQGAVVLDRGRTIGWPEIGLLAALGIDAVAVAGPLRIVVVTTGSELRETGAPLPAGAIHDANGPMLAALLASPNADVVSLTVRDDVAAVADALEGAAATADLVITTGGMSVGEEDHVRDAALRAGARFDIVKVAMKPGKPLALGTLGSACLVGLPGNPQAAAYGALAFVRPMMAALLGAAAARPMTAEAAFVCPRRPERTELLPVRLEAGRGRLVAHRSGPEGSHRLMPMVSADAVVVVPGAPTPLERGALLEVLPFDGPRFGG
jgi:molybdopterin molybdotransferase